MIIVCRYVILGSNNIDRFGYISHEEGNVLKSIIFDVGGVVLGYRMLECLMEYLGDDIEEAKRLGDLIFSDEAWLDLDRGAKPIVDSLIAFREKYPDDYPAIEWFISHAQRMPVGRPRVWEQMKRLKEKGYNIYILSNYSEFLFSLHTDGLPFWQYVDGKVVSYEIHKIKPEPEIYKYLLKKYNLKGEECLFFDDRRENCEGAEKCGIPAVLVTSEDQFLSKLKGL